MITVESAELWSQLKELLDKNIHGVSAAVAYVSDDSLVKFRKGDTLVVNASDAAIAGGQTSAKILQEAYTSGVELYSCDSLHAKAIVFDHHAYIGSANISKNSQKALNELGVISDHPTVISGVTQFIEGVKSLSVAINSEFIRNILKISVKRNFIPTVKKPVVNIEKPHSWLMSLFEYPYPGDHEKVEQDNQSIDILTDEERYWFWRAKSERGDLFEQAKVGDLIVILERNEWSDPEPKYAYPHLSIKKITVDLDGKLKAYHLAKSDSHKVTWMTFKKTAEKAGIRNLKSGRRTSRRLTEEQSRILLELWGY